VVSGGRRVKAGRRWGLGAYVLLGLGGGSSGLRAAVWLWGWWAGGGMGVGPVKNI
jgi:hypothetical protein